MRTANKGSFAKGHKRGNYGNGRKLTWTPEMNAALKDGRASGQDTWELSDAIGVGRSQVCKQIKALGLPISDAWKFNRYHARQQWA